MPWYTNYKGSNWTPDKGYSGIFSEIVQLIRREFALVKKTPGVEVTQGFWRVCTFPRQTSDPIYILIREMKWSDHNSSGPILRLQLEMAKKARTGQRVKLLTGREENIDVFWQRSLVITFPDNYPSDPPTFRVDDHKFRNSGPPHNTHIFDDGRLCILMDVQWEPDTDTIISALYSALDLLVWHNGKFGW